MKCDIVIPVWNLKDYTQQCVESIIKNTEYPYRLIIIDNGSEKETKEYLEGLKKDHRLPGYILIRNEKNLGFPKATNQGMQASDAEYVCLHNNDTIVMKGWLSEMIKVAELSQDIGIVNPASNNLGHRKPWYMSLEKYAEKLRRLYSGQYIKMANAIGFCYLIKREVINNIGILAEDYGLGNFEDTEYCIRAARNGYKSVLAMGGYVWHAESTSFNLIDNYEEMFKKNQKIFYEMFGKPQRFLYIITKKNEARFKKLRAATYELAKKCNWIWAILSSNIDKNALNIHANSIVRYVPVLFRLRCVVKPLVKKKKFDFIITDDQQIFSMLVMLKRFHKARVINSRNYIFTDDSNFLRVNLGCCGRTYYGYMNIDEQGNNKRVIRSLFSDLPIENKMVKNILLDYDSVSAKTGEELNAAFNELERISVPGCILSVDNFNNRLDGLLEAHNFVHLSDDYKRLFSVKSFIYSPLCVKNEIRSFINNIRACPGTIKLKVLNEKLISEKGQNTVFFDKSSLAQIFNENDFFIDSLDKAGNYIEIKATRRAAGSAPAKSKKICAIGQYMLWRYKGLGFDWDSAPRCFEKLGMEYLLIDGMRNLEFKKIREAIVSFRPDYLLVILKDTLPIIKEMKEDLKSMGTRVIYWFCDPEHPKKEDMSDVINTMFLTNRGQVEEYKNAYNLKKVFYMPQGFGPYAQHRLELPEIYDVGFAGAISSAPLHRTRKELIDAMSRRYNVKTNNAVRNNIAEFYSQSKTVFGASDFNSELYTSNRFYVALGCGACYITKKFQGIELLAKNKEHVLWFEDKKELFDILDYYLSHDSERNMIREAASKLAMERHTYEHRLRNILDIVEGRTKSFYGFL
ncbi:MAG: glycosyltransferase [Candidatus Omnitrophica bacterium]|nr:glycosyltransferase [Candidatus Omnitrophota bacterium]MBU4590326.1 glycosyltransferase [Candidatus Omnitrophota bacterium]